MDVGLGLLAAPYKKLTLANQRVSAGQVSIQSQGPLEFCDALNRAVGEAEDHAHAKVGEGMLWSQRKRLRRSRFRRREARSPVVCEEAYRNIGVHRAHTDQRIDIDRIKRVVIPIARAVATILDRPSAAIWLS